MMNRIFGCFGGAATALVLANAATTQAMQASSEWQRRSFMGYSSFVGSGEPHTHRRGRPS